MKAVVKGVALLAAVWMPCACNGTSVHWTVTRTSHFSVYSQSGERQGRSLARSLEQLHSVFESLTALPQSTANDDPLEVVEFASPQEYAPFQLRPLASAYFVGEEARGYIVMPRGSQEFQTTAHEYAHAALHSRGLRLPAWFAEGVAEVFSTAHIDDAGCTIGADLPARTQILHERSLMPLDRLLQIDERQLARLNRSETEMFYAESWALTGMLVFSPEYFREFKKLATVAAAGHLNPDALDRIYTKSIPSIAQDLHSWIDTPKPAMRLPGIPPATEQATFRTVTDYDATLMLADLALASGDLKHAQSMYIEAGKQRADDASIPAALGIIALRGENRQEAREQWQRAVALGIEDPKLCYEYAILADDAGAGEDEVIATLQRAIQLRPGFDDARYKLGLLESNLGNYVIALDYLESIHFVPPQRAYAYWTAVAFANTQADRRERAEAAADNALQHAVTAEERISAKRLAYLATTDLTVQVSHDPSGALHMITARKPHRTEWNPFIEPDDHIRSVTARIQKVECSAGKITAFEVTTPSISPTTPPATLEVDLADPSQVLITGGRAEFVCDSEDGRTVEIQYAEAVRGQRANAMLRGMQIR